MAKRERFRRRERTVDDIRRKASEGSRDYDRLFVGDIKVFMPVEGENIIRIMPATWGMQPYSDDELEAMSDDELAKLQEEDDKHGNGWDMPLHVHYRVGADNASYLCREKMLGERCPICEAKAAARDPDEADALTPTKRALAWVIDRNAEKDGPQAWSMPWTKIRNEIYARSVDKKHGTPIFVDDEVEGFDITFNRAGKDERTNYTGVEIDRDPTPLHDDEKRMDRWLDYTMDHRLPDILNFYDEEHLEKVLFGHKSSRRTDEEDEQPSGRSGSRRSSIRDRTRRERSGGEAEERDYMDDDAPDADPDETSEEALTRSRRRSRRSEPAEEDEAPPTRSSRRRRKAPAEDPDPDDEDAAEEVDEDTDADEEDDSPTGQARRRLGGLRSRRSRSK